MPTEGSFAFIQDCTAKKRRRVGGCCGRDQTQDQVPGGTSGGKAAPKRINVYTMVVCLDMLNRLSERNHWLELWEKEHPDDPV